MVCIKVHALTHMKEHNCFRRALHVCPISFPSEIPSSMVLFEMKYIHALNHVSAYVLDIYTLHLLAFYPDVYIPHRFRAGACSGKPLLWQQKDSKTHCVLRCSMANLS